MDQGSQGEELIPPPEVGQKAVNSENWVQAVKFTGSGRIRGLIILRQTVVPLVELLERHLYLGGVAWETRQRWNAYMSASTEDGSQRE